MVSATRPNTIASAIASVSCGLLWKWLIYKIKMPDTSFEPSFAYLSSFGDEAEHH